MAARRPASRWRCSRSDGKVYQIAGGLAADKNAKLIAHISHTVEVTGDVMDHGGKMMIAADSLKMISK